MYACALYRKTTTTTNNKIHTHRGTNPKPRTNPKDALGRRRGEGNHTLLQELGGEGRRFFVRRSLLSALYEVRSKHSAK